EVYDASSQAEFSVSATDVLAYTSGSAGSTLQLTWLDRSGRPLGTIGTSGDLHWPRISPNGSAVAYERRDPRGADVWIHDLMRDTDSRFTFHTWPGYGTHAWSPDGSHIAFSLIKDGRVRILTRDFSGRDTEQQVDEGRKRPADWSQDGRYIVEA